MSGVFPWSTAITAAVGLAGVAGSVLTSHLANRASERRVRLEHREADRTRFHSLRVEVYAKLIAAIQAFRLAIVEARPRAHELTGADYGEFVDSFTGHIAAVLSSAQLVTLVASASTRQAARDLMEAMLSLSMYGWKTDNDFVPLTRKLDEAEAAFSEAVRAELLPPGESYRPPTQ